MSLIENIFNIHISSVEQKTDNQIKKSYLMRKLKFRKYKKNLKTRSDNIRYRRKINKIKCSPFSKQENFYFYFHHKLFAFFIQALKSIMHTVF